MIKGLVIPRLAGSMKPMNWSERIMLGSGEFGDEGGEEVRGGGAGGGELRFQRVHQGHQLLDFAHDPALFGEGFHAVFQKRPDE
jgi:hypothetical protein